MRCTALIWILLSCSGPVLGGTLPFPEVEKLDSGLEVAWLEAPSLPLVDMMWIVPAGHRNDPSGKSGVAEILAALFDQSTAVEGLGANIYSSVDEDYLTVGVHGLASDGPGLLSGLIQTLQSPKLLDEDVARERAKVAEKLNHLVDFPDSLVGLPYQRLMLAGTPYGRGAVLRQKELAAVSSADVQSFFDLHVTSNRGLLLVVGRFDRPRLKSQLSELLEKWGHPARRYVVDPSRHTDPIAHVSPGEILILDRPELSQAQLRVGWPAPGLKDPDRAALEVGNALLGESFGSLLNAKLRDDLQLTYGVGSNFTYYKEHSVFTIHSATRPDLMGRLLSETLNQLLSIQKKGVSEKSIEEARSYLEGNFPLQTSTLSAVASRWVGAYLFGLGPNALNDYLGNIHRVTPAEVNTALARLLVRDKMRIVIAGNAAKLTPVLRAAGMSRIRVVKLSQLL